MGKEHRWWELLSSLNLLPARKGFLLLLTNFEKWQTSLSKIVWDSRDEFLIVHLIDKLESNRLMSYVNHWRVWRPNDPRRIKEKGIMWRERTSKWQRLRDKWSRFPRSSCRSKHPESLQKQTSTRAQKIVWSCVPNIKTYLPRVDPIDRGLLVNYFVSFSSDIRISASSRSSDWSSLRKH